MSDSRDEQSYWPHAALDTAALLASRKFERLLEDIRAVTGWQITGGGCLRVHLKDKTWLNSCCPLTVRNRAFPSRAIEEATLYYGFSTEQAQAIVSAADNMYHPDQAIRNALLTAAGLHPVM